MLQKYKYFYITKLEKVRVYNSWSKEGSRVEPLNKETINTIGDTPKLGPSGGPSEGIGGPSGGPNEGPNYGPSKGGPSGGPN